MKALDFLHGKWVLRAEGIFCERIINITKQLGIFIQNIKKDGDSAIIFTISRKGALRLFAAPLPEDISLTVKSRHGLPAILEKNKNRYFLFLSPVIILICIFLSTNIIWNVNIIDASPEMEEFLLSELKSLGVKRGVFKFTIDQSDIKNKMLIKNEELQWLWVDIKGGTALVRFSLRTPPPEIFDENAFYNVYSTADATVTKVFATNGESRVREGDKVSKGQLLIEGVMAKDSENKKFVHATGKVFASALFEKTISIPKKVEIRTPTGEKTEHLTINFLKFNIKLFINSSILYPDCDIIEYNRKIGFLPLCFNKKVYSKVNVTYTDNNISAMKRQAEADILKDFEKDGKKVTYSESTLTDVGEEYLFTVRALCEFDIAEERRMNFGENYSVTDN